MFNFLIEPLGLTIRLRMVCSARIACDSKQGVEFSHKGRYKVWTPITDDLERYAVMPKDFIPKDPSDPRGHYLEVEGYNLEHF